MTATYSPTTSEFQWDLTPFSPASVYSCSTYYSDASSPPSSVPTSWSELDRSLKTFDTTFDTSCFDEMEDELIDSPQESFAAMCYQSAVARTTTNDPDWCVFIKTPNRCNWQEDENTLESPVDSDGSLRFASIDPCAKPDSPFVHTFPNKSSTRCDKDISLHLSLPFLLHDPAAIAVLNPNESVHFYPTVSKKPSRRKSLTKVLRRLTSFTKLRS